MQVGDTFSWVRTFTVEDIRAFAQVSGDAGAQHITPDAVGRLMVQGLLTATLPTKIGGDLNYIARDMYFVFERPVYAGDTIACAVTLTELEPANGVTHVSAEWVCRKHNDKIVLTGSTHGIVRE